MHSMIFTTVFPQKTTSSERQSLQKRLINLLWTFFILTVVGTTALPVSFADGLKATWIGWSSIKITESGFDFGGQTFLAGAPTTDGWVDWFLIDGQLTPSLSGYLHMNDVPGLCARMRMDYYVEGQLWMTKTGSKVCASDDKHHVRAVTLSDYTSSKIDEVRVSIEKLTAIKDWTIVGSQRRKLVPIRYKVKITEDGFDFGGKTFLGSGPTNSGEVTWTWKGAQVSPRITGTLHINNAATACARMRIEYFKGDGTRLTEKFSGSVCAPDNKRYSWDMDLEPYSDNKLTYIKISLQTQGADNAWHTAGSTTSDYLKVVPPVTLCGGIGDCLHDASTRID